MSVSYFEREGAPRLAYRVMTPPSPKVRVLLTTGFGEHMGRYPHVHQAWQEAGIAVAAYDLRGQGDSEGPRGHVDRFSDWVEDAFALLDYLDAEGLWQTDLPLFLFGHSLGGLISTHTALKSPSRFSGLALSSPFFGLSHPAAAWQIFMAKLLEGILPRLSQPTKITANLVTHDPARAAAIDADPKGIHHISLRWFVETQRAQNLLLEGASSLLVPTFCIAAGDDNIADLDRTKEVFSRLNVSHTLEIAEGAYHELHMEPDGKKYIARFAHRLTHWDL